MEKVMMTLKSPGGPPSIDSVAQKFGLEPHEIDRDFGVVPIDPADGSYTILVDRNAASKIRPDEDWEVSGPYSNPIIEPFGPPR